MQLSGFSLHLLKWKKSKGISSDRCPKSHRGAIKPRSSSREVRMRVPFVLSILVGFGTLPTKGWERAPGWGDLETSSFHFSKNKHGFFRRRSRGSHTPRPSTAGASCLFLGFLPPSPPSPRMLHNPWRRDGRFPRLKPNLELRKKTGLPVF